MERSVLVGHEESGQSMQSIWRNLWLLHLKKVAGPYGPNGAICSCFTGKKWADLVVLMERSIVAGHEESRQSLQSIWRSLWLLRLKKVGGVCSLNGAAYSCRTTRKWAEMAQPFSGIPAT